MTATDFINIFEPIPDRLWCIGHFATLTGSGELAHCAMGHVGGKHELGDAEDQMCYALMDILKAPGDINDGRPFKYHGKRYEPVGSTPKERILNALREKVKEGL